MPRRARLDIPGALHHIMVRGIDESDIFKDDQDRSLFVERLGQSGPAPYAKRQAWMSWDYLWPR